MKRISRLENKTLDVNLPVNALWTRWSSVWRETKVLREPLVRAAVKYKRIKYPSEWAKRIVSNDTTAEGANVEAIYLIFKWYQCSVDLFTFHSVCFLLLLFSSSSSPPFHFNLQGKIVRLMNREKHSLLLRMRILWELHVLRSWNDNVLTRTRKLWGFIMLFPVIKAVAFHET